MAGLPAVAWHLDAPTVAAVIEMLQRLGDCRCVLVLEAMKQHNDAETVEAMLGQLVGTCSARCVQLLCDLPAAGEL